MRLRGTSLIWLIGTWSDTASSGAVLWSTWHTSCNNSTPTKLSARLTLNSTTTDRLCCKVHYWTRKVTVRLILDHRNGTRLEACCRRLWQREASQEIECSSCRSCLSNCRHGTRRRRPCRLLFDNELPGFTGYFTFCFVYLSLPPCSRRAKNSVISSRAWCNGNILASQAKAPGSTPGARTFFFVFNWSELLLATRSPVFFYRARLLLLHCWTLQASLALERSLQLVWQFCPTNELAWRYFGLTIRGL